MDAKSRRMQFAAENAAVSIYGQRARMRRYHSDMHCMEVPTTRPTAINHLDAVTLKSRDMLIEEDGDIYEPSLEEYNAAMAEAANHFASLEV